MFYGVVFEEPNPYAGSRPSNLIGLCGKKRARERETFITELGDLRSGAADVVLTFCIDSTRGRGGHESPRWIRALGCGGPSSQSFFDGVVIY